LKLFFNELLLIAAPSTLARELSGAAMLEADARAVMVIALHTQPSAGTPTTSPGSAYLGSHCYAVKHVLSTQHPPPRQALTRETRSGWTSLTLAAAIQQAWPLQSTPEAFLAGTLHLHLQTPAVD
jgi:hypothetical protein